MSVAQQARLIDADRRALERIGVRSMTALVKRVRGATLRHLTGDWRTAMARGLADAVPVLRDGMLAADLAGRYRAVLTAKREGVSLSEGPYLDAVRFFQRRLGLNATQIELLAQQHGNAALMRVEQVGTMLEEKVQAAIDRTLREGLHVKAGTQYVRAAFDSAGVTPQNSYTAESIFRTQTAMAYEGGKWQAFQEPDLQAAVWGFQFSAIGDDRTTEFCMAMDGVMLRKDNPAWARLAPPAHFGCRSSLIAVFDENAVETPIPPVEPAPGFEVKPWALIPPLPVPLSDATF